MPAVTKLLYPLQWFSKADLIRCREPRGPLSSWLDSTTVLSLRAVRMTASAFRPVHLALFATVAAVSILRGVGALARLVLASHDLVPS
jgi:hypothetical protein